MLKSLGLDLRSEGGDDQHHNLDKPEAIDHAGHPAYAPAHAGREELVSQPIPGQQGDGLHGGPPAGQPGRGVIYAVQADEESAGNEEEDEAGPARDGAAKAAAKEVGRQPEGQGHAYEVDQPGGGTKHL